ncbi:alpha/beta hydrolase [Stutzerimonas xanthomarina]|jgi:pimeloyl-ACP methyl ester carboxylesterase|uniref:Alpha/beta hydrolase n=1 Tax=Stutzerimonas xanthomarina TaxID=271420 RepID=A0A3R8VK18_9GAMM|nr:alpha/beta hydrolase [Stutzerimonas kunmingensis]MCW8158370.1 alpha/beta hydrolase [Stutzerimonas stutzeri]RRV13472.1 alpha/beta hydrolase [Stutzerimonas xanthomarina]
MSVAQAFENAEEPGWLSWAMQRPGRSCFLEVDGRRLHYLSWGEQRPERPVLLLVHGMRAHAHWWDAIAPYFSDDYRVVALDLSGMGDSDHRQRYPDQFGALDIIDLIEGAELGPVTGVGHSYGGSRLLHACADRPDLFKHLVVLDSFIVLPEAEIPIDSANTTSKRYYPDLSSALQRYRLMPEQPDPVLPILARIARHSLREEEKGWCWKFDINLPTGVAHEENGVSLLPRVLRPVDVIYGECSSVISRQDAQQAVELLPQGRGPFGIPGTHHHMMIDQPLAVIAILRGLLASGEKYE